MPAPLYTPSTENYHHEQRPATNTPTLSHTRCPEPVTFSRTRTITRTKIISGTQIAKSKKLVLANRIKIETRTRLPSNLRLDHPRMCACSYACLLRLHDKDGGHTIRFAVPKNSMLHANSTALCLIERELLPIEVLHCGHRNFRPFWLL